MESIVLTGGTGLVGRALAPYLLQKGYSVTILTRKIPDSSKQQPGIHYALWDIKNNHIDTTAIEKATHIIHLAGAGVVDKRWSDAYKTEIEQSRVQGGLLIARALQQTKHQVKTLLCASAIGWYGADASIGAPPFTETAPPAMDFLGHTCQLWEQSTDAVTAVRVVKLRTGIVLSNEGGALAEFKKPLALGIAAVLGTGQQVVSWIHITDLCRMYVAAIQNNQLQGVYNAVAPQPVSNKTLTLQLAKKIRGRFFIPINVPAWVLKIVMGESSVEVLKSCTVSSQKISQGGFTFLYPSIDAALTELCHQ
ncbi:MAG: hypothetical protein RL172_2465 [Bacteroidota bacterium]